MTALAASREADRMDGVINDQPVLAAEIIYKGSTVVLDATNKLAFSNDGTTNTLSAGDAFAGICVETADNSDGLASAIQVRVFTKGVFLLPFAAGDSIGQDDVSKAVYVNNTSDDGEVTITADGGVDLQIGTIYKVGPTANTAYVLIDNAINNVAA